MLVSVFILQYCSFFVAQKTFDVALACIYGQNVVVSLMNVEIEYAVLLTS